MEQFDSYHKWLGIPPAEQPPNHYRLLGIQLFESDPDVISNAADRQMTHVKSQATGKKSELTQKLLNKLAAAKLCLLQPEQKTTYDQKLQAQQARQAQVMTAPKEPSQQPGARRLPVATRLPERATSPASEAIEAPLFERASSRRKLATKPRDRSVTTKRLVVALAIIIAFIASFAVWRGLNGTARVANGSRQVADLQVPSRGKAPSAVPAESASPTPEHVETTLANAADPVVTERTAKDDDLPAPDEEGVEEPLDSPAEAEMALLPKTAVADDAPITSESPSVKIEKGSTTAQKEDLRWPVPETGALEDTNSRVTSLIGAEPGQLTPAAELLALSRKSTALADESTDQVERFSLLIRSRDLAARSGDFATALGIVDRIAQQYAIAKQVQKAELLEKAVAQKPAASDSVRSRGRLALLALATSDEAVAENDVPSALRLAKVAQTASQSAKDRELTKRTAQKLSSLKILRKSWQLFDDARKVLVNDPADPQANQAAGRFLCYVTENWNDGLLYLANGPNGRERELAALDLTSPTVSEKQVALGDHWWDFAAEADPKTRASQQRRAAAWYRKALPRLVGLERAGIERRLSEVPSLVLVTKLDILHEIGLSGASENVNWSANGAQLEFVGRHGKVKVSSILPKEYTLLMDVQRSKKNPGSQLTLEIGSAEPLRIALDVSDRGKTWCELTQGSKESRAEGGVLSDHKPHQAKVVVRAGEAEVFIDGRQLMTLSISSDMTYEPRAEAVSLSVMTGSFVIGHLRMEPLTSRRK